MVDWEAYQQGVLAARAAVLGRSATFLGALPKDRLSQMAELSLCVSVDAGTLLARQGAPLECMVVVQVSGQCMVYPMLGVILGRCRGE